jgi:predicted ester cyclase
VDAVMAGVSSQLAVYPDMNLAIDEAFAEGNLVAVRWSGTGTNEGEFLPGLAPSGQETAISGINIYQLNCGQIVESWSEINGLSMLRQIQEAGAAATPAA